MCAIQKKSWLKLVNEVLELYTSFQFLIYFIERRGNKKIGPTSPPEKKIKINQAFLSSILKKKKKVLWFNYYWGLSDCLLMATWPAQCWTLFCCTKTSASLSDDTTFTSLSEFRISSDFLSCRLRLSTLPSATIRQNVGRFITPALDPFFAK